MNWMVIASLYLYVTHSTKPGGHDADIALDTILKDLIILLFDAPDVFGPHGVQSPEKRLWAHWTQPIEDGLHAEHRLLPR